MADGLTQTSDEQLVAKFQAGEQEAFSELVGRYEKRLFNYLQKFLGKRSWAEDVFQDTFLQVYTSVGSFDVQRRFRPWLYTIATNKARDLLRSRARRPAVQLTAADEESGTNQLWDALLMEETTAEQLFDQKQARELVREVVGQLPDHLRQIIILAYFEQLSYKEMAEVLEIPIGTVKSRLHAAVGRFSRRYREQTHQAERT